MRALIRALTPVAAALAVSTLLVGCGHSTEQRAASGAVAGAVVGGPVGAVVAGAAGTAVSKASGE